MAIAVAAGLWQLANARSTASEVQERRLLLTALAISNDVISSGGDVLAPATEALLEDGPQGTLFYHVYAPDGVIVTGYATPPVGIPRANEQSQPTSFRAIYHGRPVDGVRIRSQGEIDGVAGLLTTTVWQDASVKNRLVLTLMTQTLAVLAALTLSVALIVWFGVRIGLKPLADLEAAIALRSGDDLSPIRRAVPPETAGIVARLNTLFGQVSRVMSAQAEFVGNAAHQLRNPVAGMLAMAEAVEHAPDWQASQSRARDLVAAARKAAGLTDSLLQLERVSASNVELNRETVNLRQLVDDQLASTEARERIIVVVDIDEDTTIVCDPILLGQALTNLVDNALHHGGPDLGQIVIQGHQVAEFCEIIVEDDGKGVPEDDLPTLIDRFRQLHPGTGSGLGLSIADAIARAHSGSLTLESAIGLRAKLRICQITY
ncbi:MAG: sensor histidine kinase [Pseudomonadota bacterium]